MSYYYNNNSFWYPDCASKFGLNTWWVSADKGKYYKAARGDACRLWAGQVSPLWTGNHQPKTGRSAESLLSLPSAVCFFGGGEVPTFLVFSIMFEWIVNTVIRLSISLNVVRESAFKVLFVFNRLIALKALLQSLLQVEDIVKVHEARLTEKETTTLDLRELDNYRSTLKV